MAREWDARINRRLYGPRWTQKPDERLFAAYFLEKPVVNPHWHVLVMLDEKDLCKRHDQEIRLKRNSEYIWRSLKSGGTVEVRDVFQQRGVIRYVVKELGHELQYKRFVVPREFNSRF